MGFTSFAIRIQSPEDLAYWEDVIHKHNTHENPDEVGEELDMYAVLRWTTKSKAARPKVPSGLYLLAGSGGGRSYTSAFLWKNRHSRDDVILGMDDKPAGWYECEDFVWKKDEENAVPPASIFDIQQA